jgi:hypothetical protein
MRRRIAWALALSALVVVPSAGSWSWPVEGQVVQPFAFDEAHPYAAGQHRGIDIAAAPGSPVVAPAGGTVTFAGTVPSNGTTVSILSGSYSVTLTQLGSLSVRKGQGVAEGATVGTAGGTVHLGVRVASDPQGYVDPMLFLPALAGDTAGADDATAPATTDASGTVDSGANGAAAGGDGASVEPTPAGGSAAPADAPQPGQDAADPTDTSSADTTGADAPGMNDAAAASPSVDSRTDDVTSTPEASPAADAGATRVAGDPAAPAASADPSGSGTADGPAPTPAADQSAGDPSSDDLAAGGVGDGAASTSTVPADDAPTAADISTQPAGDAAGDSSEGDATTPEAAPPDAAAPEQPDAGTPTDTLDPLPLDEPPAPVDTSPTATAPAGDPVPPPASAGGDDIDPTAANPPSADPPAAEPAVVPSPPATAVGASSTPAVSAHEQNGATPGGAQLVDPTPAPDATSTEEAAPARARARAHEEPAAAVATAPLPQRAGTAFAGRPPHSIGPPTLTFAPAGVSPQLASPVRQRAASSPPPARTWRPLRLTSPVLRRPHGGASIPAVAGAGAATGTAALTVRIVLVAVLVLAAMALVGLLRRTVGRLARRIISGHECEPFIAEDSGRGRVAVRERPASHRSCGGFRRPVGHLRALPPAEGRRRPHGQRDGRARHTGDGRRGQGRRVNA